MHSRFLVIFPLLLAALLSTSCGVKKDTAHESAPLSPPPSEIQLPRASIRVNDAPLTVEIARTPVEKAQGLSGRQSLAEGTGMLFVFVPPVIPSFWMKEMRFPLDMIWIYNNRVVDIHAHVPAPDSDTPLSALSTYSPHTAVDYVLEVPAGWADANSVTTGASVDLLEVDQ